MLAKAASYGADEIVLDLEDAVAIEAKDRAREQVVAALNAGAFGDQNVSVRVNAPGTRWCHLDLIALTAACRRPRSVVVPKVETAGDLSFVERLLDGVEQGARAAGELRVQALIETAAGLAHVTDIAASSARLESLILGYADLAASLGRSEAGARDLDGWRPAQETLLVAARAHGLQAINGPYWGVDVDSSFTAAATRARDLGFDGTWVIHPRQVVAANGVFEPTGTELARARSVIDALDAAARDEGRGAVTLNGEMIDEAMRIGALRTFAQAGMAPS